MARPQKRKTRSPNRKDHFVVSHARVMYDAINGVFPGLPSEDIDNIEKHCRINLSDDLRTRLSCAVGWYCYSHNFDKRTPIRSATAECLATFKSSIQNLIEYFNMGGIHEERGSNAMVAMRKRIFHELIVMRQEENRESTTHKIVEAYSGHGLWDESIRKNCSLLVGYLVHNLILMEVAAEQAQNSFDQEFNADSGSDVAFNELYRDLDTIYKEAGCTRRTKGKISFFCEVFKLIPAAIRPASIKDDSIRRRADRAVKKRKTKPVRPL